MDMEALNTTRGQVLGTALREAGSFVSRLKGLLGDEGLPDGAGLWLSPCKSIHSIGMKFDIDVLFLDSGLRVVGLYRRFPKNRISGIFRNARGVLELPSGVIERTGTEVGDEIVFRK